MSEHITDQPAAEIVFPDERKVAAEDARRFRELTPTQRFREIFALMAWALQTTRNSPRRAAIEKIWEIEEAQWRKAHQDLIAKHGQRITE